MKKSLFLSAIDAAADGDIIYMTLGAFNKPFTINKEISIRGVGEKTVVNGDVTVDIPNSPKLENTLMEGVRVIGTLDVKSAVGNLVISKCMIDNVKFKQKVIPGDTLIFKVITLGPLRHNIGSMQGYAFIGENCVAEATFTAQVIKK